MTIPKYVQELMSRATWEYDHPDSEPGYTVRIRAECNRLVAWANRQPCGADTAYLLYCPRDTHYTNQIAIVTIYDPVMQQLERYMGEQNANTITNPCESCKEKELAKLGACNRGFGICAECLEYHKCR